MLELNDSNFEQEVLKEEGLVMVDFWAVWCGPCRALAPVVEDVAKSYEGRLKVAKFDVDGNTDIPARYGVRNIPTLLFFKKGELVDKSTGSIMKTKLIDKVESLL